MVGARVHPVRLLVVEDEANMREMLRRGLAEEGHTAVVAGDGASGLNWAITGQFDLILLDVMLPGMNGFELTRRYRLQGGTSPILMLTARDAKLDQIRGLDGGADDYLTKPFLFDVLLPRIRALTRRMPAVAGSELRAGPCRIDVGKHEVFVDGQPVTLSKTEFALLAALIRQAGKVVTREALVEAVWGQRRNIENNTLDTFIRLLRSKLRRPRFIETVRGVGYMIRGGDA
jgi:DNA-binding response OmpR family regulator